MSRKETSTARRILKAAGEEYVFYSLPELAGHAAVPIARMPYSIRILLEGVLRNQGRRGFDPEHLERLLNWQDSAEHQHEIPFMPARILLQDFTGVPCLVDLAALRSSLADEGADPAVAEPSIPVDLVIDHSIQLDCTARADALECNLQREFARNSERYTFLRWGRNAFHNLRVMPPSTGICHQVNIEYLATCVSHVEAGGRLLAFPDTLVGTDSHTTTVNALGVLGWGVGGIEAEAAMLGEPIRITVPRVIGVELTGSLPENANATDLALTLTRLLREKDVVGCFLEFFGPGLASLPVVDRAPLANMAPEYGATIAYFPIDSATLHYLRVTGRSPKRLALVEAYARAQGLFLEPGNPPPEYSQVISVDISKVEPCLAGPRRPHEWVPAAHLGRRFDELLRLPPEKNGYDLPAAEITPTAGTQPSAAVEHGSVVIASITSCTNTANPFLLVAAGLLARNAAKRGLKPPPHVRTSFAPGSRAVAEYLSRMGLLKDLGLLGFDIAAYGCATCIGNSGPLPEDIEKIIREKQLVVAAVLSGNRNFEGRIHPAVKANFLCSPPMVVALALRGTLRGDIYSDPLGYDNTGRPVFLRDIWPAKQQIADLAAAADDPQIFSRVYTQSNRGPELWEKLPAAAGATYAWDDSSSYIRRPPFFDGLSRRPTDPGDIRNARCLALLGDFITTDHISPAGTIPEDSPAGRYLVSLGIAPDAFNTFGSRRGNHEVMIRGTFANIRIRNRIVTREGGWTRFFPGGEEMTIYDAAMRYRRDDTPLLIVAGRMYGAGSSRDWAAKGTALLGVRAVIAESFERIHRSNLIQMGVLPLEFMPGESAAALGLDGTESYSITGISKDMQPGAILEVHVATASRRSSFRVRARLDTPSEVEYYRHGGILPFVFRSLLPSSD